MQVGKLQDEQTVLDIANLHLGALREAVTDQAQHVQELETLVRVLSTQAYTQGYRKGYNKAWKEVIAREKAESKL